MGAAMLTADGADDVDIGTRGVEPPPWVMVARCGAAGGMRVDAGGPGFFFIAMLCADPEVYNVAIVVIVLPK
jgi:hypothetical protein